MKDLRLLFELRTPSMCLHWGALMGNYERAPVRDPLPLHPTPEVMMPAKQEALSTQAAKPARLSRAQRTAILKALADPKRFELLERIARASCPLACSMAGEALAISPATLSHHIKELEAAGLIQVRPEGKFHYLSIKPGVLEAIAANLQALSTASCPSR